MLAFDYMSSDESDFDDDNNEILVNHKIPWLSQEVEDLKKLLDDHTLNAKSPQSIRQMKRRVPGSPSSRPLPENKENQPSWVFN